MSVYEGVFALDLPGSLQEMVQEVGFAPVLRLVERFGGTRLYVPRQLNDRHPLFVAVGQGLAGWLSERWGNDILSVPRAAAALRRARNREICRCYDKGVTVNALAMQFALTDRHIWRILGDPRNVEGGADTKNRQLSLNFE